MPLPFVGKTSLLFGAILGALTVVPARAHFVWIDSEPGQGGGKLQIKAGFGEPGDWDKYYATNIAKTQYHVIVANGTLTPVSLSLNADEGWYHADVPAADVRAIVGICEYGVVSKRESKPFLLRYYAKHLTTGLQGGERPTNNLLAEILAKRDGNHLRLTVLRDGKPVAKAAIKAFGPGIDKKELVTDTAGSAVLDCKSEGTYSFFARVDREGTGTQDGKVYQGIKDYATLTLTLKKPTPAAAVKTSGKSLPSLRTPIASFGAAMLDGQLYVYGGHTGTAHEHSRENLSKSFVRLNLSKPDKWEELPMGTPLQGLGLATADRKIVRAGGMYAANAPDETEDLHSVAECAVFDPAKKTWTALPPLPEARSSHDLASSGSKLFVVGGWTLNGKKKSQWLDTVWSLDLKDTKAGWKSLPTAPFQRRALNAVATATKLYAVCGLTPARSSSTAVDILDLGSGRWSKGPNIPGGPSNGFGPAVCLVGDRVVASVMDGSVYRLSADEKQWESIGQLSPPRFLHRLAGAPSGDLLVIAGAGPGTGHLTSVVQMPLKP